MLLMRISVGLSLSLNAPCLLPAPELALFDFPCISGIVTEFFNVYSYNARVEETNKTIYTADDYGFTEFQNVVKNRRPRRPGPTLRNESAKTAVQRFKFVLAYIT